METLNCDVLSVREVNRALRMLPAGSEVRVINTAGRHNIAVGLTETVSVLLAGNSGYFTGALSGNSDGLGPDLVVDGFVGWSVGENLMGGSIRVKGSASQSAAASARGGTIVIEGNASLRAGISLKGATLAVAGNVGAMSGFMAQAGILLVGGDAGHGLGDSLYEAVIYVAGSIASLGADAQVEEMSNQDILTVKLLIEMTGFDHIDPHCVTRVASARQLYNFSAENHGSY